MDEKSNVDDSHVPLTAVKNGKSNMVDNSSTAKPLATTEKGKGCCCGKCKVIVACILIPLGILIAIAGTYLPKLFKNTLMKKLVIQEGNSAYENWHKPKSPVYMKYYVFNYTNVDEMKSKAAIPHVSQLGPYAYREIRVNEVVDYTPYNITYIQNYSFVYDPSMSCAKCNESDIAFIPSISMMTLLNRIGSKPKGGWLKQFTINSFFNSDSIEMFKKVTVHQAIWGYKDPLLSMLKSYSSILTLAGFKAPKSDTVALQHNGTAGALRNGNITVLTGKEGVNQALRVVKWRGLDTSPYWLSKYAEMINGTDGTRAPPFLKRNYKYYVFVTQLCRSLYFEYQHDLTFRDIKLYRFATTAFLFANETINPDNAAFCSDNKTCWYSGLLPIAKCKPGKPPIFMSSPHFYQGDPVLLERVKGLNPTEELHGTYLDVEPTTGITFRAYKRLQINVMGMRTSWLEASHPLKYKHNFLPMLFIEEIAAIDPDSAAKFRKLVLTPKKILAYGYYVLIALGGVVVLVGIMLIGLFVSVRCRESYTVIENNEIQLSANHNELKQIA